MFCYKCGGSIPDDSTVCPQCSAPVTVLPPPSTSTPAAAPAPAPAASWQPAQVESLGSVPQTDGKAIAALVLGILSFFCFSAFTGIPAIICGHLSRSSIRQSMGRLKGDGMALAGLIMGYVSIGFFVLIIAAVAVPSLLRSRMLANESAAGATVRTVVTAQITYSTEYPNKGFAPDLATLGPGSESSCTPSQEHACLVDKTLGGFTCTASSWCMRNGFKFNVNATCGSDGVCSDFVVTATPATSGTTGTKSFCATSDGIVRVQKLATIGNPLSVEECKAWSELTY